MGYWNGRKSRARRINLPNLEKTIPKSLTIQDLELGFYKKRISYSYCKRCGRILEGWEKLCYCTGTRTRMQNSWVDINWNSLVTLFKLKERHNLFRWGEFESL